MWPEILAQIEDSSPFVKMLVGGGVTGLLAFVIWLLAKGVIKFGREDAQKDAAHARELVRLEKELDRRDKELLDRTADRDKWIASFLQNMEITRKQGEAVERLKESVEGLKDSVEALARVVERRGPG